jgi:hypothetical protein
MREAQARRCSLANDVFDIASDIRVEIEAYDPDVMIWSVSRWDEDNWSSGSEVVGWQELTCSVSSVSISNGLEIEQGLIRPEPATATIVFQDADFDPFVNSSIRAGTPIRVLVRPNPDTAPLVWELLYQGKIDTSSASYNYDWVNTVTLNCVTNMRDILNYTSIDGLTTAASVYAYEYLDAMNLVGGFDIRTSTAPALRGYLLEGISSIDPVEFGSIVNQLMDTNLGALVYRPRNDATASWYYTNVEIGDLDTRDVDVAFQAYPSAAANRSDFSDISIGIDTDRVVNTVNFTTTLGYSNSVSNSDSIALLGSIALDVETLHFNDADADAWASEFTFALPQRRVLAIQAPAVLRSGQVNENLLREPLDVASVSVDNAMITIEDRYFISRVTHDITPDSWDTTFDLWTGR